MSHPTPSMRWIIGLSSSSSCGGADVHDAAGVEHDGVARDPLHDAEVLLDEQHGGQLRHPLEHLATSVTSSGERPFVGSSTSSTRFSFRSARPIASICCCPPESVPARLLAAFAQLREEVVDEVVPRLGVPLGEPQVLVDRQRREDVAILGDVPDAAPHDLVGRHLADVVARELDRAPAVDEPHQRAQRRRLADAVPAEQRGHSALGDVERDPLQHVRLAEVDVQVARRRGAPS